MIADLVDCDVYKTEAAEPYRRECIESAPKVASDVGQRSATGSQTTCGSEVLRASAVAQ